MKKTVGLLLMLLVMLSAVYGNDNKFYISTSYKNLLSNTEKSGMLDRIMKEVFDRIGLEAEIVFTRTEKSLVDVNAGLLDGELNRVAGMENQFPNLLQVPEPNMTMHFVAFATQDFQIDGWESIRNLYIGIVRGWKILEQNTAGFPHRTLVPSESELFSMLHKERLDVALYSKLTGYAALKEMNYDEIFHLEPPLASRKMYLYVHKRHADLVPKIADALQSMKDDGSYQRIVSDSTDPYLKP
ncbi:MAG: transporter substrate-binding domain-containing protein [Spirochaetia bacterium]|nr:transporter substrate-binding domain-containing protein [Spirochaetia bacterium]